MEVMTTEEIVELWSAIEYPNENDNFVMTFKSKQTAEELFKNEFHLFFIRPFKIKQRFHKTRYIDELDEYEGAIEFEIVNEAHNSLDSKFIYFTEGINILQRRTLDGVLDNNFKICVEYSSRPKYEPSLWYSQVITAYIEQLK